MSRSNVPSDLRRRGRQSEFTIKLMMIPFLDSKVIIYIHWVPSGQMIQREYYVEVLRGFRKRFHRKRLEIFQSGQRHPHQDNTAVQNSIPVANYWTEMGIKTVPHPPYSPDFAPCDFWLFSRLRENLRNSHFDDIENIMEAVTSGIERGMFKVLLQPSPLA